MADQKEAASIKQEYEKQWLSIAEVVAIGIGRVEDTIGILVSVKENPEKVRKKIPNRIKGVPIKIQETGEYNAL